MQSICLRCDGDKFTEKPDCVFSQDLKGTGTIIQVRCPGIVCDNCGWQTLALTQLNAFLKACRQAALAVPSFRCPRCECTTYIPDRVAARVCPNCHTHYPNVVTRPNP